MWPARKWHLECIAFFGRHQLQALSRIWRALAMTVVTKIPQHTSLRTWRAPAASKSTPQIMWSHHSAAEERKPIPFEISGQQWLSKIQHDSSKSQVRHSERQAVDLMMLGSNHLKPRGVQASFRWHGQYPGSVTIVPAYQQPPMLGWSDPFEPLLLGKCRCGDFDRKIQLLIVLKAVNTVSCTAWNKKVLQSQRRNTTCSMQSSTLNFRTWPQRILLVFLGSTIFPYLISPTNV